MMRQAGRYHSHYQNLRSRHTFVELCKVPELAAETAMGPIRDFDFDVAILFSDLLFPLEALGMGLTYEPAPTLSWQLTSAGIKKLRPWHEAIHHLEFQKKALQATRAQLPNDKSLIGFVGGPWTLFTYAVEGAHKGHLTAAKTQPQLFAEFIEVVLPLLRENIRLQIEGGAEVVMIFDTAAGEIAANDFGANAQAIRSLAEAFPNRVGYYSKGTVQAHYDQIYGPFAGFGFDHRWSMAAQLRASRHGFVQGNFDQVLLFAEDVEMRIQQYLKPLAELSPDDRRGFVCGLGHGVLPQTPETSVRRFVELVRKELV